MYTLAKIVNFVLNNKFNMFLSLNIFILLLFSFTRDLYLLLFLECFILLLVFTTKRVSNVLVYNSLFHIVSMNLKNVKMFAQYNYEIDKNIISDIFKEELIKGLLKLNVKRVTFESHQWVLQCLLKDEKINEKYLIRYKGIGTNTHILDVLLFTNGKMINIHPRIEYNITLIKK